MGEAATAAVGMEVGVMVGVGTEAEAMAVVETGAAG